MPFEFPFNLIGILTKAFLNRPFMKRTQILDLSRSLVPSVEQTSSLQIESVIDFTGK